MRLAVPEHQGRVSPVFDCCRRLLVIDEVGGDVTTSITVDWSDVPRPARPSRLQGLGVGVLLCGGISCGLAEEIEGRGIEVLSWVSGGVDDVLEAFFGGRLPNPELSMPGRCGRHPGARRPDCSWKGTLLPPLGGNGGQNHAGRRSNRTRRTRTDDR